MLRDDLVDDDVDLLHVEKSLFRFHLYSCYRGEYIYDTMPNCSH
jgi:hypothetical protein